MNSSRLAVHNVSVTEILRVEKIMRSYVRGFLSLTRLAPDIVEVLLDAGQSTNLPLQQLMRALPSRWNVQRVRLRLR
jgi:hypothetical protein